MTSQKKYRVDSFVTSKSIKVPVVLVTTANVVLLSGAQTIETVVLSIGDRVLIAAQTDPKDNGIYDVEQNAWNRSADWDGSRDATNGTLIISTQTGVAQFWELVTASDPFIPGSDDGVFQIKTPNDYEEGTFTINWDGFTTTVTSIATYRKIGKMVVLNIGLGLISGTSNSTIKTSTAGDFPASIVPSVAQVCSLSVVSDNGSLFQYGNIEVYPTGFNLRVFLDAINTLFTASGATIIKPTTIAYYL